MYKNKISSLIIQWGLFRGLTTQYTTHNLPTAFSSANYCASVTRKWDTPTNNDLVNTNIGARTVSSIDIIASLSGGQSCLALLIGY